MQGTWLTIILEVFRKSNIGFVFFAMQLANTPQEQGKCSHLFIIRPDFIISFKPMPMIIIFTCFLYLSNLRSNFPFKVQVSSNVAISNIWSAYCFLNKWEEWLLWDWLDERKVEGGEKLVTPYVSVVSPVHWMIFHIPASNKLDRLICI